jgi:hypothetical protein
MYICEGVIHLWFLSTQIVFGKPLERLECVKKLALPFVCSTSILSSAVLYVCPVSSMC